MIYSTKMIISGNVVEIKKYGKAIRTGKDGYKSKRSTGTFLGTEEERKMREEKSLKDSLRRTRESLTRLINSNKGKWGERDKFFTLTFRENLTDQSETNKLFTSFIKKLSYSIFKTHSALKYVCVVERQERGAIHYHVVLFNMPYVPHEKLLEMWGHGGVRINAIDEVDNVGVYVMKYMQKTMQEAEQNKSAKEKDKKLYFASRGLHKSTEYCDAKPEQKEVIEMFENEMADWKVYEKTFPSEYHDFVNKTEYNLERKK